mgnify:CR=1 FL=1
MDALTDAQVFGYLLRMKLFKLKKDRGREDVCCHSKKIYLLHGRLEGRLEPSDLVTPRRATLSISCECSGHPSRRSWLHGYSGELPFGVRVFKVPLSPALQLVCYASDTLELGCADTKAEFPRPQIL